MSKSVHREKLVSRLPVSSIGGEVGVHKGQLSEFLIEHLSPKKLHLIDPWRHEESDEYKSSWYGGLAHNGQLEMDERYRSVLRKFEKEIYDGKVVVHRCDSQESLPGFDDEFFDWLYIDGNHLYEYVKKDLELAYEKVKKGGFVAGDDYEAGGWWDGGVMKAVDEFCSNKPSIEVEFFGNQFLIRK